MEGLLLPAHAEEKVCEKGCALKVLDETLNKCSEKARSSISRKFSSWLAAVQLSDFYVSEDSDIGLICLSVCVEVSWMQGLWSESIFGMEQWASRPSVPDGMVYCWFVMTVHSLGCTAHNWARQHQSVRCEPHQVDLWCAAQVFCRGFYSRDFTCTDTKLCSVNTAVSPISSFISWRDSDCCKKIYLAVNN